MVYDQSKYKILTWKNFTMLHWMINANSDSKWYGDSGQSGTEITDKKISSPPSKV